MNIDPGALSLVGLIIAIAGDGCGSLALACAGLGLMLWGWYRETKHK